MFYHCSKKLRFKNQILAGRDHIGSNRQCPLRRAGTAGRKSLRWESKLKVPSNRSYPNRGNVLR